jgi:hypothetical protein
VKRIFCSPLPIRPDGLSSPAHFFLFFCAGPAAAQPAWPTLAQTGPSPGRRLPSATEATATLPSHRHTVRHRQPPSRTRMELNRSAARPPSLSHTSSAPHRLQSPIQCRNQRGLKIHRRWPPPLPTTTYPKLILPPPYCLVPGQVTSAPPPFNFAVRFPEQPSSFWSSHGEVWCPETPRGVSSSEPLGRRHPESTVDHRSTGLTHPIHRVFLCKIIHFPDNTLKPLSFSRIVS